MQKQHKNLYGYLSLDRNSSIQSNILSLFHKLLPRYLMFAFNVVHTGFVRGFVEERGRNNHAQDQDQPDATSKSAARFGLFKHRLPTTTTW